MENNKIQLKGITRNTDDGICQDGECMELINARINNSSIEPVGKPVLLKQTAHTYTAIYHHVTAKRYIGVTGEGQMYEMPEDLSSENIMTDSVKAIKLEFIGNTVSALTDDGVKYLLFRNGGYIYLGELPNVPKMTINKKLKIVEAEITEISETEDTEVRYGNYLKVLSEANKNGYYSYSAAFCAAFRMFDGSYIKSTEILIPYLGENDSMKYYMGDDIVLKGGYGNNDFTQVDILGKKALLLCFKPEFTFEEYDLTAWSDIIVGIDIFSTDNFRKRLLARISGSSKYDKDTESPITRASNISLMYNVASLTLGGTSITPNIDVSVDNLSTLPAMVDSFNSHHKAISRYSYAYNNRLHAYGITSRLPKGFSIAIGTNNYTFDVYTYIHASNGDKIIKSNAKGAYIPAFFMYPDSRAYRIVVNCPSLNKGKTFELKSSDYFSYSYYRNELIYNSSSAGEGFQNHTGLFRDITVEDFDDGLIQIAETDDVDYSKPEVMKVSGVNNPFFFPADQTYQFQSPIVGLQSNVIAMSQGQFGQFPLYVFTKDGVYAMTVGSGTVAYSNQIPITRDVCNNPDSICGLDTMVAFSTDKGLMVIDGASTSLISEKIYGFLPSCSISSPIIGRILNVASLGNCLSSITFPDYLESAKVGFNYETHEIIVANSELPYSYVYSLKTGEWYKISQKIENFVNSYPYTWALTGTQILDLNNTRRSVSIIALMSRPIKLGTLTHKRILQSALRGIVKRSLSDLYIKGEPVMFRGDSVDIFSDVGMYILASNDAEHFELVAKKEKMVDIRDLVTKMNKSKPYKYFMMCLVGGVRTDVSLNYVEIISDQSFTNRLR